MAEAGFRTFGLQLDPAWVSGSALPVRADHGQARASGTGTPWTTCTAAAGPALHDLERDGRRQRWAWRHLLRRRSADTVRGRGFQWIDPTFDAYHIIKNDENLTISTFLYVCGKGLQESNGLEYAS
ncbi:hypothetical protein ABIC65_001138 [Sphingomonas trueperi]|uniref:hypothetical protein n=1 Tax=Sphingomonas trueperi TaxID=53317 RepID=UPI003392E7D9